jgi:hypothetical protein
VKKEGFVPALTDPTRVEQLNEAITGNTISRQLKTMNRQQLEKTA